jgi:hypothetical protein
MIDVDQAGSDIGIVCTAYYIDVKILICCIISHPADKILSRRSIVSIRSIGISRPNFERIGQIGELKRVISRLNAVIRCTGGDTAKLRSAVNQKAGASGIVING